MNMLKGIAVSFIFPIGIGIGVCMDKLLHLQHPLWFLFLGVVIGALFRHLIVKVDWKEMEV